MDSLSIPAVDLGAQSCHDETQFLFLEGDVRQSDTDEIRPTAGGEFFIPQYIKFL